MILLSLIERRPVGLQRGVLVFLILLAAMFETVAQQPMTGRMANINGASIYYEAKGSGFPIVFVSGGGILDRRCWDQQFETFSKHYRVIRYDVRGIGKSSRPNATFSHSQDLHSLLTFLKIKRSGY